MQAFRYDRGGNIAIIVAFALPVFLAALALGFELSQWYMSKWRMQNAADSAVIAATNNHGNYQSEARAVAAQYGYVHGVDNVSVAATNTATCPGGGNDCYQVTINRPTELYLSRMVGFVGSTTVNGRPMQGLASSAVAKKAVEPREYCILALAGSGENDGIRTNGAPQADLPGCDIMSNTDSTCNGHNLNVNIGDAAGTNNGCGTHQYSNMPVVADPYAALASNVPSSSCTTYPQGKYSGNPKQNETINLTAIARSGADFGNLWSTASVDLGSKQYWKVCGDMRLMTNVSITAPSPGAVLIIYNGRLDTNGYTLQSTNGTGLTVVFAGTNDSTYVHAPVDDRNGIIDIAAPISGTWSGIALYQIPSLTVGVDVAEAGNTPAWNITGMVYLPHASVTLKGIVNKASYGASCFGLVVDNLEFSGTNAILAHGECDVAGLDLPYNLIAQRAELIY